jgi:hypothetical protein
MRCSRAKGAGVGFISGLLQYNVPQPFLPFVG